MRSTILFHLATACLIVCAFGCKKKQTGLEVPEYLNKSQSQIFVLTQSENQIQALANHFSNLTHSFRDATVSTENLFDSKFKYRGFKDTDLKKILDELASSTEHGAGHGLAEHVSLPLAPAGSFKSANSKEIWHPVLELNRFENCNIGTLAGKFLDASTFQTDTKFEGLLRGPEGKLIGVKALQSLQWTKQADDQWKITQWDQTKFDMIVASEPIFKDVTADVFPNKATFDKVQSSSQTELLLKLGRTETQNLDDVGSEFAQYEDWESAFQYPGASVVDIDQDGFDDLFITDRWQSAQLLRNQGDGTFKDVTESSGLKVEDLACCALFADFDNDGDSDVFVGRTLKPSQFYENRDGVFHLDTKNSDQYKHIKYVVSGSVVDVNGDGLLDLYLNTYGFPTTEAAWQAGSHPGDRKTIEAKVDKQHWFIDRPGGANVLLMNRSGQLKRVEIDKDLAQWRNSFQTVWADYDQDGDHDLYICNDFSPDYFLRNDTERGSFNPKFTDVSDKMVEGGTMGFGMGASWGDYNNDGLLDLYISNMYSKAGNRIVAQMDEVDERIKVSALGCFLYENQGKKFKQVSGTDDSAEQQVSIVGWSFGGQFADFDNDGKLDLYCPSGYFTPPKEIQQSGDL